MAKVQIAGNIASITMGVDAKVVDRVNKFVPDAMELRDEDGKQKFVLSLGKGDSFSTYGATFQSVSKATGKYSAAIRIENEVADPKAYVAEHYGTMIANLNAVEAQITEADAKAVAAETAIDNAIEVVE